MKKIKHPRPGNLWECNKTGLQREVIEVTPQGNRHCNDFNVVWKRPGTDKEFTIWLPYWVGWCNNAHRVF